MFEVMDMTYTLVVRFKYSKLTAICLMLLLGSGRGTNLAETPRFPSPASLTPHGLKKFSLVCSSSPVQYAENDGITPSAGPVTLKL